MYQDLKDIEIRMLIANFAENQYNWGTNTNTSTNTNANTKTVNHSKRPTNSSYSWPPFMVLNPVVATCPARNKVTRLIREEIAKLQRENHCFTCKEVGNHRPEYLNRWQSMLVFINADSALTQVNISEVAVP